MEAREKILRAALRVYEEAGSRGATTRRIASVAGVNEITLFRHFGSKGALLTEAVRAAALDSAESRLPDEPVDPAAELTEWCRAHYGHLLRMRALIRTCMGELEQEPELAACAGATPARVAAELEAYLVALRERGMADAALDHAVAAAMLMSALFADAMGRDVMPGRYSYTPDEAPARYVKLFLRAIGAVPGPRETPGPPRRTDGARRKALT
jgi:AcrR family transcriptional regulator